MFSACTGEPLALDRRDQEGGTWTGAVGSAARIMGLRKWVRRQRVIKTYLRQSYKRGGIDFDDSGIHV